MATITPIENGLHSLAKALESFDEFHSNPSDAFALKDAVLRTHHAVETLSKAILFDHNPAFLLKAESKIGQFVQRYEEFVDRKNTFIVDDEFTIGLTEALDRLRRIGELSSFPDSEFYQLKDAARELEDFRNALQHFAIDTNVEVVARVIGNVLPRFVDLLDALGSSSARYLGYGYHIARRRLRETALSGFRNRLSEIFPESERVLTLLRTRYDSLIRKTTKFLKGREFADIDLNVEVSDHGRVGAPPYLPQMSLSGFLTLDLDPHRMAFARLPDDVHLPADYQEQRETVAGYEASVTLSRPVVEERSEPDPFSVVSASLDLQASVSLRKAETVLQLPDADQFIPVLRDVGLKLKASMDYKAVAHYDEAHYHVQSLVSAEGSFSLSLTAIPSGYESDNAQHLIAGNLIFDMDKQNAPFRLHAFVHPDGSLRDNYLLDWKIGGRSTLRFF